ncbi:MAG: hypothetical protein JRC60_05685 [Deltaproteobacteria bacterium]|nr:hypothetical protein [Deltaproteobacteria bacterium]
MNDKIAVVIGIVIICCFALWQAPIDAADVPNMAISALAGLATGTALTRKNKKEE